MSIVENQCGSTPCPLSIDTIAIHIQTLLHILLCPHLFEFPVKGTLYLFSCYTFDYFFRIFEVRFTDKRASSFLKACFFCWSWRKRREYQSTPPPVSIDTRCCTERIYLHTALEGENVEQVLHPSVHVLNSTIQAFDSKQAIGGRQPTRMILLFLLISLIVDLFFALSSDLNAIGDSVV